MNGRYGCHATCARSATCEKSGTGETDDGSRYEVRGFQNFEPRTSNFVSRQSRPARLSQTSATAAEAFMIGDGANVIPSVALSDVLELDMLVDHGIKVSDCCFVTECL